jgi:hypothetical protein
MPNSPTKPYDVYQDKEQWIPWFNWFWIEVPAKSEGHGGYPFRCMAVRAAKKATRG